MNQVRGVRSYRVVCKYEVTSNVSRTSNAMYWWYVGMFGRRIVFLPSLPGVSGCWVVSMAGLKFVAGGMHAYAVPVI